MMKGYAAFCLMVALWGVSGGAAKAGDVVACEAPSGALRVVLEQPSESVFTTGHGECWLRMARGPDALPLRLYVSFDAALEDEAPATDEARVEAVKAWLGDNLLVRGRLSFEGRKTVTIEGQQVELLIIRGLPPEGHALWEVAYGVWSNGEQEVRVLAHYPAHNRQGFRRQAKALLSEIRVDRASRRALSPR